MIKLRNTIRQFSTSKVLNKFQEYKPYTQKAPECYYDLPKLEQRTVLKYDFQKKFYKSMIP